MDFEVAAEDLVVASLELECVLDIVDAEGSKYSGKGQKAPFFAMLKEKKVFSALANLSNVNNRLRTLW